MKQVGNYKREKIENMYVEEDEIGKAIIQVLSFDLIEF